MNITHSLDFCELEMHSNYTKAIIYEGITINQEQNKILHNLFKTFYKDTPFAYISHRIYSYSINPEVYLETSKIKNLIGLAVVSDDPIQKQQVVIEKIFSNKPFKYFTTMKDALLWKDNLLSNHKPSIITEYNS